MAGTASDSGEATAGLSAGIQKLLHRKLIRLCRHFECFPVTRISPPISTLNRSKPRMPISYQDKTLGYGTGQTLRKSTLAPSPLAEFPNAAR